MVLFVCFAHTFGAATADEEVAPAAASVRAAAKAAAAGRDRRNVIVLSPIRRGCRRRDSRM